jgi:BirA family biotin operon repressor/biotin-[acetyl-CoA-carboxylase] ligase
VPRVEVNLPIEFWGVPAERHESLPSTNDEAFRRATEGAPEGLLVVAGHQSAGRGRQGRGWWDRPGDSVLASLLLRPTIPLARYPLLGMAMAAAVAEAAERLIPGERFDVKWPNDVLHRGRKLSGILAETRIGQALSPESRKEPNAGGAVGGAGGLALGGGPLSHGGPPLVIGFGVNVNQTADSWPAEIQSTATSLRLAAEGRAIDPDVVLREILARFDTVLARARSGDLPGLWNAVKSRLPRPGSAVVVTSGAHRVEGTVEGYAENGAIMVRDTGGLVLTLAAGEIPLTPGGETETRRA